MMGTVTGCFMHSTLRGCVVRTQKDTDNLKKNSKQIPAFLSTDLEKQVCSSGCSSHETMFHILTLTH